MLTLHLVLFHKYTCTENKKTLIRLNLRNSVNKLQVKSILKRLIYESNPILHVSTLEGANYHRLYSWVRALLGATGPLINYHS